MTLPQNEAALRVFVREACQRYVALTTGTVPASLRDRHVALAAQHDAVVALRRLLKRKGMRRVQIENEVLAVRS